MPLALVAVLALAACDDPGAEPPAPRAAAAGERPEATFLHRSDLEFRNLTAAGDVLCGEVKPRGTDEAFEPFGSTGDRIVRAGQYRRMLGEPMDIVVRLVSRLSPCFATAPVRHG